MIWMSKNLLTAHYMVSNDAQLDFLKKIRIMLFLVSGMIQANTYHYHCTTILFPNIYYFVCIAIRNDVDDEGSVTEMKFPGSTYTLLFTSPIMSIPFIFASMSTSLCYICLLLSLFNLFSESSPDNLFGVPAGVKPEVRGAQYVGVLVGKFFEFMSSACLFMRLIGVFYII